jgi:hypothetical protein
MSPAERVAGLVACLGDPGQRRQWSERIGISHGRTRYPNVRATSVD